MAYNYLNQPHQGQQQHPEYAHPVPAHSQHGLYPPSLSLPQPSAHGSQVGFLPPSGPSQLHPQYRHPVSGQDPMELDGSRQGELRNHNVVTTAVPGLQPNLPHIQMEVSVSTAPHGGYPPQVSAVPHRSTENPSNSSSNGQISRAHPLQPEAPSLIQLRPMIPSANLHGLPVSIPATSESSRVHGAEHHIPSSNLLTLTSRPRGSSEADEASAAKPKADDSSPGSSLPDGLAYKKLGEKGMCVIAEDAIPKGIRFGPFKGAFGKGPMHYNNMLSWELTLEGMVVGFLSPVKGEKDWMTFVRCAKNKEDLTAEVGQYCGRIYFTTIREIQPGEELKVFYSDDYWESCGFKLGLTDLKYNADSKSFECPLCPCHCSTSKSLLRHVKVSHQKEKLPSINVNLPSSKSVMQPLREAPVSARAGDASGGGKGQFFLCSICGKLFPYIEGLQAHKKVHGMEEPKDPEEHACSLCGFLCLDSDGLAHHMERHKLSRHGCEQCGQVFKTREEMLEHKKDKHRLSKLVKIKLKVRKQPHACNVCGYTCSTPKELNEHVEKHKTLPYGCPECGSMYTRRGTLLRHLRDKHNAQKMRLRQSPLKAAESSEFRCDVCFFNCPNAQHFKEHMEKHKVHRYGCDECGLVFSQVRFLIRHKRTTHTAPFHAKARGLLLRNKICPWGCDECSKTYANLKSLRRHQKNVHGRDVDPPSLKIIKDNLDCYLCEATFKTNFEFKKHLLQAHGMEAVSSEKKSSPLVVQSTIIGGARCYICSQFFKKPSLLQDHLRQHHGIEAVARRRNMGAAGTSMSSEQQQRSAAESSSSVEHIDMLGKPVDYYNRPRPFKCNECSRRFVSKSVLRQHMLKFHIPGSKYSCSFCQKGFSQESQLLVHIQTHTNIRPFKCGLCPRSFASQSAYNNHQPEHTGEKPHKCDVCGRGFRTTKQMNKHKRRVHSTKEKPHKCSFCDKRFLSRRDHEIHERRHKGIRPFVCLTCGKAFKDKHSRQVHYRVHTGEKPFPCPMCGKNFAQQHALTDHMVMHTKENMEQAIAASAFINN